MQASKANGNAYESGVLTPTQKMRSLDMKYRSRNVRNKARQLVLPMFIACAIGTMTDATRAASLPVVDIPHTVTNKLAWIMQYQQKYEELKRQIQQYETQIRELEQKYVRGDAFKGGAGYRETLSERGLNDFVVERCGNGTGLPVAPKRIAEISLRQYQNCVAIVQTENTRYNVMVRVLKSLAERDQQMDKIKREAESVPEDQPGALERVNNNIAQFEARLAADIQNSKTLLDAYDASLQALHSEQVWLGQAAFSNQAGGKGGIGGLIDTAVQYGTLKTALEIARSRDR